MERTQWLFPRWTPPTRETMQNPPTFSTQKEGRLGYFDEISIYICSESVGEKVDSSINLNLHCKKNYKIDTLRASPGDLHIRATQKLIAMVSWSQKWKNWLIYIRIMWWILLYRQKWRPVLVAVFWNTDKGNFVIWRYGLLGNARVLKVY